MKKRPYFSGALIHCYENSVNGYLLFYSQSDHLVCFSIICVCANRHNIRIVSLCQMPDHLHLGVVAKSKEDLSSFMRDVLAIYSKSDALVCHRKGALFNIHFGSAPKKDSKAIRTNIIYIGNNPVERKLCVNAAEYRWNYLAYAKSTHPFSEKLIIRKASWSMKKAIKEVKGEHRRGKPLSYALLQRLFDPLDQKEKRQLVDFIITTYSVIDYDYAASFFDGYDNMIKAMSYTVGKEYDIKEVNVGRSDACYQEITQKLIRELHLKDIHEIFSMPESFRTDQMLEIHTKTKLDLRQLAKYFRLKIRFE